MVKCISTADQQEVCNNNVEDLLPPDRKNDACASGSSTSRNTTAEQPAVETACTDQTDRTLVITNMETVPVDNTTTTVAKLKQVTTNSRRVRCRFRTNR